jgi:hypothetical protein
MKIDDFTRNEQNEVVAICGDQQIVLSAEYIETNKPQVGDDIVETPAEEAPKEE